MLYCGIDPGGSGGLALISDRGRFIDFEPMPDSCRGILEVLDAFRARASSAYRETAGAEAVHASLTLRALLEKIQPQPASARQGAWSAKGASSFFKNIGHLEMALEVARIPYDELRAQEWQPIIGLRYAKGEKRDKNRSKAFVERIFPTLENVTHAAADALLLAEVCRRINEGGVY
jgi:hypothetical protein